MSKDRQSYWDFFAADAARIGSPLYARLAAGVRDDPALRSLAERARPGQPPANLILGAVHFLLLQGAEHPLKRFYPSCGGMASVADEDPFPLFADFVATHEDEIAALIESRVTNTNEIGRSAVLHPGFRAVAAEAGAPLNLIEIGPSAGLNLIWDRYGVRYSRDGAVVGEIAPEAGLVIEAELRGDKLPPLGSSPAVARRMGLELYPTDLGDGDERDWLRALVWPDMATRFQRLGRAIDLFRSAGDAIEIRRGDALALLLDAVRDMPENESLCVYHTIAVYQFSAEMKQTFEDLLTVAGLRRPVWRLGLEYDGNGYLLSLSCYRDGTQQGRALAHSHPHGAWLEWLD